MQEEVVAVFVPIVMFLIVGIIWVTYLYLKFREKQLLIEKGFTPQEMKDLYTQKKNDNPYLMTKLGIISIFLGIGIGLGVMFESANSDLEFMTPLCIFCGAGLGLVLANIIGKNLEKKDRIDN